MSSKRSAAPTPMREPLEALVVDDTKIARIKSAFEILALIGGALAIVIPAMGHLSLRHRSRLLGLPDGFLEYEAVDVAVTGAVVVWEGFVRAVASLVAHDSLTWLSWFIVGFLMASSVVRLRSTALSRVVTLISVVAIYIGGTILLEGMKAGAEATSLSSPFAQFTFEMRSWLENEGNVDRRELAAGLVSLLVVWCAMALRWSWTQPRGRWRHLDRLAFGALLVELALLVALLPQAHAYARWGREYPRVAGIDPSCGAQLAATLQLAANGRAWLVSGGARREVLLTALPQSAELTAMPLTHPEGGRCAWTTVTLETIPRAISAK